MQQPSACVVFVWVLGKEPIASYILSTHALPLSSTPASLHAHFSVIPTLSPMRKFDNQSYLLFFVNTEVYVLHADIRTLSLIFLCPLRVLRPETWCLEERMTKGGTLGGRIGQPFLWTLQ